MTQIHKTLKQMRIARNLTQEDVASKIGLTRQAISSYESGRTQPPIEILLKFAEIYGVELDEILYENKDSRQIKNTETKYLKLASEITLIFWCSFHLINIILMFIANTFYPLDESVTIVNTSLDKAVSASAQKNIDLYFQLSHIGSSFETYTDDILLFGGLALLILDFIAKPPAGAKQKCRYIGILFCVSIMIILLSYIMLPSFWINTWVTLQFNWYIIILLTLSNIAAMWIKRKIKRKVEITK